MGRTKGFDDQLRRIIKDCGQSRYRLAQKTGIDESTLSKFMLGKRGLSMSALNALAAHLKLKVVRKKES